MTRISVFLSDRAGFIWHAWKLLAGSSDDKSPAKALFACSILYLFAILPRASSTSS